MALSAISQTDPTVALALREASKATGVGFDYLLDTAMRESALKPDARAQGSSAAGLFQFVESTWLGMVKSAGDKFGLGQYAEQIERGANGQFTVSDAGTRAEILALRHDPRTSALMAAEFTRRNAAQLEGGIGRQPTGGELYMAHFLGAGDAERLIDLADTNPQGSAAELFPRAAQANRSIFYDRGGAERSLAEVYDLLSYRAQPAAATDGVTDMATNMAAEPAGENKVASFFAALFRFSAQEGSATAAPAAPPAAASAAPAASGPRLAASAGAATGAVAAGGRGADGVEHRRQVSESYDLADLMKSPDRILAPRSAHTAHSAHGNTQVALGGDPSMPGYVAQVQQMDSFGARQRLDAHEAYGRQNSWLQALGEQLGLVESA